MIQKLKKQNITAVAKIASENFSGLKDFKKARKWINANFLAYPRMQYFILKDKKNICGYIFWVEKGGFRENSVWELEQIAVSKVYQGKGLGTKLIEESLEEIKKYLKKRGSELKIVEVTTGVQNKAQKLYKKTLKVVPECKIKDFFRGDEVIMIKRF